MNAKAALAATTVLLTTVLCTPAAYAVSSIEAPPTPDAELVSETVKTGLAAAVEVMSVVEGVKVGRDSAVVTVREGSDTRPITLDYGDLSGDKRTAGVGYAAGGYLGLGLLARLLRVLRQGAALLGMGR